MEFGGYVNFPIEQLGKFGTSPILRQSQVVFGGKWRCRDCRAHVGVIESRAGYTPKVSC